ncbi:hypothetical protein [Legionella jordanis]|uniref:Uncharacterized protein n=1 Tax=Legionella jordanis TaxID=456 RepID=A0A0W0V816_9GAMM|nr:hypothetical protein [Legionella jordanis]KTD16218.1 hypothetical protein Ljor_0524 [Legionella jordanis]RMX04561.1 hypothetical protein EAW55_03765 [Legionella jordanis]RMX21107.1 hypothetical protein EAS68_05225 [Legionella jordanis]VEH12324.1 Uncharacterised protein [Legionella jordanis]HAT8713531.1 hypothetical protein [Legionella jordanis]
MKSTHIKLYLIGLVLGMIPLCGFSSSPNTNAIISNPPSFLATCVNSWMQRMDKDQDKTDYRNFGEKYCDCAAQQPLDNAENINKAMQLCMSQTLLEDTMDSLENEVGFDKVSEEDLDEYCADRFALVFPKMNENSKQISTAYCNCAKPRLMRLIKVADNMTDGQYSNEINQVAAACSSGLDNETAAASATR